MVELNGEHYIDPNTTGLDADYRAVDGTAPKRESSVDSPVVSEPQDGA